jgi:ABC-type sugar transport system permease subunit
MDVPMRKKRTLLQEIWRERLAYIFIAPFFISFAVFGLYPLFYSVALSFYQWDGGRVPWFFVGFENFTDLFLYDRVFRISLRNSMYYWVVLVPLLVGGSLLLAVAFNAPWLRGRGVYRTILFLPHVTSGLIMGLVFLSLLDDDFGWLNATLLRLHLPAIPWLRSTTYSKFPTIIVIFWRNVGYYMIMMLAGLQSIDLELYEAASIDGANSWQAFRRITLPLMRPIILFVAIITTNMVLNMFQVVFSMTQGGPSYSSQPLMLTLYERAFEFARYGAGSAFALVLSMITITIAIVQIKFIGMESR